MSLILGGTQPAAAATSKKTGFRPDIQGLRAIAVGLVVLYHSGVSLISGGYVGVDVFFVISGFLITTHLLESLERQSKISFATFYAKRARRILPASMAVVVLSVIASVIWIPPLQAQAVFDGAMATALYVPNMLFAVEGTNYLAETAPSVFQHYWSLGIEEQFYLCWPVIFWLAFLVFRRSEKRMLFGITALVVVSFILCIIVQDRSQPWAFFSLPTRAWELGAGGLIAFLLRTSARWILTDWVGLLGWLGLAILGGAAVSYDSQTPFPSYYAAVPVLAGALIIIGGAGTTRWSPTALLSTKPLQFLGMISYSLYLVHWPLLTIPQAAAGLANPLPLYVTLFLGVAGIPFAYLLYRFVEEPFRKSPLISNERSSKCLILAGTASVLVVTLVAGLSAAHHRVPLHVEAAVAGGPITKHPQGTPVVPSNLNPGLRAAADDSPTIYADNCHRDYKSTDSSGCLFGWNEKAPRVVLFGDSHAAQWFPALEAIAETGQILLETNTKSSCSSAAVARLRNGAEYPQCAVWREGVMARLATTPPELILLTNRSRGDLEGGNHDFTRRWQDGIETTIRVLAAKSKVVVLADTPDMQATPAVCLSAHLHDAASCSRPRATAIDVSRNESERSAAAAEGAAFLDLSNYFCSADVCPAIIRNELVYRDAHHITTSFSSSLSPALSVALLDILGS